MQYGACLLIEKIPSLGGWLRSSVPLRFVLFSRTAPGGPSQFNVSNDLTRLVLTDALYFFLSDQRREVRIPASNVLCTNLVNR